MQLVADTGDTSADGNDFQNVAGLVRPFGRPWALDTR